MIRKKKYQWTVVLGLVGGLLSTKTAIISAIAILEGIAIGAVIGYVVGWFLDRRTRNSASTSAPH